VLPSRREGLPLVLIEAMAAGKPIVTSGVDGIASVAKDKINCLLFNKNDASDLGAKIELLLDNPKLANKLAQNNRKKAMQYDWDIIAEELQNIYGDKNEEIS
jgi:glycosyltransferase involved in cell wall biosynthesis